MSDSDFINPVQHNQDEVLFDSGGTCDCYRLVKDNRVYCVKRPKKDMRSSEVYMNLFRKEFELGIDLEHPNIVRYFAYDEDEQGPFIRMDYIDGDSLEAFVAQHPDYFKDKGHRKQFCDELFSALDYLHDKKMLHLDLKPSNILITNKGHHVKLIDLGFGWSESYLHDLGFTRDYCAPEQQTAKTELFGPATDIYALGKILQRFGLAKDAVIQGCLKENSKERYQSVGALQKAMRHCETIEFSSRVGLGLVATLMIGMIVWLVVFKEKPLPPRPPAPEGAINGLFTINEAGDQVYFAKGNLQYQATTNLWRLADHQRDAIGQANDSISPTNDGWIDLFGYGTSGYDHGAVNYQPWSTFGVDSDYCAYGDLALDLNAETGQADWGYNAILNGSNREGLWRTLTGEEWEYVLFQRNTSSGVRYAKARVDHFNGIILLPDDWNPKTVSLHNVNQNETEFGYNSIDSTRWNLMEASGAVFLPAAGSRWGNTYWALGQRGAYWASTKAYRLYYDDNTLSVGEVYGRTDGHAGRLVRDK